MIPGSEPTQRNLAHLAAFRERAMPLFNSQHQDHRGIRWRGIAATAMVELLVLSALAFAVVRYVEWSSAANQAEFMMRSERTTDSVRIAGPHSLQDLILERHALGIVLLEPSFRGVDICKHL